MADETVVKARVEYLQDRYRLGPGDVLSVDVLNEDEYSQDNILVRPDGYATFKGIGEFDVANLTAEETRRRLMHELSKVLVHPEVSVSIKSTRPATVYISGAVAHPGMFQFVTNSTTNLQRVPTTDNLVRTDMRLSNILANSGGVLLNADLSNITVTRAENGETIKVDLWKVLKEGSYEDDVWLDYSDHIHIPENPTGTMLSDADYRVLLSSPIGPKTFPVRVIGEVKTSGAYNLDASSPYLETAISMAGGFAPQANRNMVAIRRFVGEKSATTIFKDINKSDIMLRPNDVVYIAENKMYVAGRFFQQAFYMLSPFQSAAMAGASSAQIFGLGGWDRRRF